MELIMQGLVNGIVIGAIYSLIAMGYNMIYSTTRVVNFAQGEFLMIGAIMSWLFQMRVGLPIWLSLLCVAIVCAAVGWLSEKLIMVPYKKSGAGYTWIITTMATAIAFRNFMTIPFGSESYSVSPIAVGRFALGSAVMSYQQLFVIGAMIVILVSFELFTRYTFFGKAIRAAAFSTDITSLMGIPVSTIISISFILSSMINGVAGALVAPLTFADANMGLSLGMKGFVCLVVGGLGSARGAVAGGLIIGIFEALVRSVLPTSMGNITIYILLAIMLLIKPSGIFGGGNGGFRVWLGGLKKRT